MIYYTANVVKSFHTHLTFKDSIAWEYGGSYGGCTFTADRVGQNLPTFAQCWVKYQKSKLFVQFDPMMGKT